MRPRYAGAHVHRSAHEAPRKASMVSLDFLFGANGIVFRKGVFRRRAQEAENLLRDRVIRPIARTGSSNTLVMA
jgi:hypothetical protein